MQADDRLWREFYNKCASLNDEVQQTARFDVLPMQYAAIIKDIVRKLGLSPADHLVDLGCANGLMAAGLAKHCRKIVGVDFSIGELQRAAGNAGRLCNLKFVCGDASHLPLAENSADKVLMYGVAPHLELEFFESVLNELFRICKPGGKILVGDIIEKKRAKMHGEGESFIASLKDYVRYNPENLRFVFLHALAFHGRKRLQLAVKRLLRPEFRIKRPVKYVLPLKTHHQQELLEMVASLRQKGSIVLQNFRLPYSRSRFDMVIDVSKCEYPAVNSPRDFV
jgi:ubiquinone/menaquinone biosynthesis C-methylase UbiE